jgi:hypothetical protein
MRPQAVGAAKPPLAGMTARPTAPSPSAVSGGISQRKRLDQSMDSALSQPIPYLDQGKCATHTLRASDGHARAARTAGGTPLARSRLSCCRPITVGSTTWRARIVAKCGGLENRYGWEQSSWVRIPRPPLGRGARSTSDLCRAAPHAKGSGASTARKKPGTSLRFGSANRLFSGRSSGGVVR